VAWDEKNGGFFYEGHIGRAPSDKHKVWWTTAEGLNALRIFSKKYGGIYQTRYKQLWQFVLEKQLDKVNGGWHPKLDEKNDPIPSQKSDAWTEGYHQARAVFLASGQAMYSQHK
jgi:mannose/cellobiose epimerase-like protein (N-acyl-D-glucosamine 2-epimerase family)